MKRPAVFWRTVIGSSTGDAAWAMLGASGIRGTGPFAGAFPRKCMFNVKRRKMEMSDTVTKVLAEVAKAVVVGVAVPAVIGYLSDLADD